MKWRTFDAPLHTKILLKKDDIDCIKVAGWDPVVGFCECE
jgi:hypothetical protein